MPSPSRIYATRRAARARRDPDDDARSDRDPGSTSSRRHRSLAGRRRRDLGEDRAARGRVAAHARLLPGIADPRARVAIWNALRLAVADAEIDPSLALEVVVAALADETDDAVVAEVAALGDAHAHRLLPGRRRPPAALARLVAAATLRPSDVRRARVGAAARGGPASRSARPSTPTGCARWLAGRDVPRMASWSTRNCAGRSLRRLAALGATGADRIDAEAARDRTVPGPRARGPVPGLAARPGGQGSGVARR